MARLFDPMKMRAPNVQLVMAKGCPDLGEDGKVRSSRNANDGQKVVLGTHTYGPWFGCKGIHPTSEVHTFPSSLLGSSHAI